MHAPYFSPALNELRERAAEVATNVLAPRAEEVDRDAVWPEHSMRALADAGLMGLNAPTDVGGMGYGLVGLVAVTEALAPACASSAICYAMHCVATAVMATKPSDHQREQYLRPIAQGRHITTLSLSEPGTGAHFYLPQTELAVEGDQFVVNGTKHFVTSGGRADSYVVSTRATQEAGEFSALIVDRNTAGVEWQGRWDGFGMRGNSSLTMKFKDARVPVANLIGREGDQIWYVFEVVAPYFLVAMAATYLGVARGALEYVLGHVRLRVHEHTGESLASIEVLQHKLGTIWSRLEATRQLLYLAAYRGDTGTPDALPAILSCKAEVADAAVWAVNEAMTLAGGIGYRENGALPRMLRDVRAAHVMAPTTDILRIWTGRALLGQPLL
ncbi:MAG: acyl-CoA dehydrogenase family protein [Thermoanaerobaculia bacterium]